MTLAVAASVLADAPSARADIAIDPSIGVIRIGIVVQPVVRRGGDGDGPWVPCPGYWHALPDGSTDPQGNVVPGVIVEDGVTYDLYWADPGCPAGDFAPPGGGFVYVPRISPDVLLPGLREQVERQVPAPELSFENLDPEFGWAYVKVPTDFRVTSSLEVVTAEASVSNGPVTVWASVTATPVAVRFEPGEPDGFGVECSVEAAQAEFVVGDPGDCSYTYVNSSAVSSNGRTFAMSASVEWLITFESSSGGGVYGPLVRSTDGELAVAEVQALVTCTGPLPEQGGC